MSEILIKRTLSSNAPLHVQIYEALVDDLSEGVWEPNAVFPTVSELTKAFGVSAITIRRVIQDLTRDGYLETSQGSRTRVRDRSGPSQVLAHAHRSIAIPFFSSASDLADFDRGPWTGSLITALQQELMGRGYSSTLIPFCEADQNSENGIQLNAFDGLLVFASEHTNWAVERAMEALPHVVLGRPDRLSHSSLVTADFYAGGVEVAEVMLSQKVQRFLCLIHPLVGMIDLMRGFQETLLMAGVESTRIQIRTTEDVYRESGRKAMEAYLDQDDCTGRVGVFGAGDRLAEGACLACRERGLDIPGDAVVVGGTGLAEAADFDPPLSVVQYPFAKVAEKAILMLTKMMRTGIRDVPMEKVPMKLLLRRSVGS